MDDLEKRIYNQFLVASRKNRNKPFKIRKDFNGFEKDDDYRHVQKISKFLRLNTEIDIVDFFDAPYKLWPDDETNYTLSYFASRKSISSYSMYMRLKDAANPDHVDNLTATINSFIFIKNFCENNNIEIKDYFNHKTGLMLTMIQHFIDNKINGYSLFIDDELLNKLYNIDEDVRGILSDKISKLDLFKYRLETSIKQKELLNKLKTQIK